MKKHWVRREYADAEACYRIKIYYGSCIPPLVNSTLRYLNITNCSSHHLTRIHKFYVVLCMYNKVK